MLYKRRFSLPYLRSVEEDEAKYILEEIHEGICEDHSGGKVPNIKDNQSRLFMADDVKGIKRLRQKMWQMPEV